VRGYCGTSVSLFRCIGVIKKPTFHCCFQHRTASTSLKCHYEILGLQKSALQDEIRNAYIEKTKLYHPDLNPEDESLHLKFQKVIEAYSVLSDDVKRQEYDTIINFSKSSWSQNTDPFTWDQNVGTNSQQDEEAYRSMHRRMEQEFVKQMKRHEKHVESSRKKNVRTVWSILGLIVIVCSFHIWRINSSLTDFHDVQSDSPVEYTFGDKKYIVPEESYPGIQQPKNDD